MAKNVIIMGATSGIGEALAVRFAALGCDLAIAGRRADRLQAIASKISSEHNVRVIWSEIDVRREDAPLKISHLASEIGGVDLYIHAAGIGHENVELDPEIEMNTVDTNASGFVRCIDAVVTLLRSQGTGGQIAAISSVAATRGLGASPAYSATKALQAHYLEALRQMVNAKGWDIRITDIRPGFVDTPLLEGKKYPMTLPLPYAADHIVKAILKKKTVAWIDWKYQLLCAAWVCLPKIAWENLPVGFVPFYKPDSGKKAAAKAPDASNPAETPEAPKASAAAAEDKPEGK